jgi:DNA (cytosine-5)-methyltransferase 1
LGITPITQIKERFILINMTHGSLFSGIGGFDLAAEWMGWENVFHCEWNDFGQKVLHHYWPKAISYHDITKTDFTIHRGKIDILTGGFPCQPYSSAGKRKGKEDERHLWPSMLRAIREIQPRWVVGENVLGLVNWSGGLVFHEVQADLEAAGYEVWPYVLPAVSVNAPHRRDRVWFVAKNTKCNGFVFGEPNQEGAEIREFRNACTGGSDGVYLSEGPTPHPHRNGLNQRNVNDEYGDVADTESQPSEWMRPELRKFSQQEQRESGGTHSQMGNNAADTCNKRLQGSKVNGSIGGSGKESDKLTTGCVRSNWQNFPTQSPICSRNDGLSSRLDGITFSKWRNESIKAAGNAIVPQVVYQIFKAIEQYETLPRMANSL